MKFRVKDMNIATGGILVAILNQKDARLLDLRAGDRVLVRHNHHKTVAILDISQGNKAVPEGRIGLFEEVLQSLGVKDGSDISLSLTDKPESVKHIYDKLNGKTLDYTELYHVIEDIVHDRLTDIEKTYFVAAGYLQRFTNREVVDLTKAMVRTGNHIHFDEFTLDKHSIGGVPGNRTTMIIVPIVTAAGLFMPKTSSRAITSPAGTADTMEVLAKVELSEAQVRRVVRQVGGCIIWGGTMNLAPADDKIITVEHPLSIDAEGQLLASVMSKKASVSANAVLIDIPMGKRVKVKHEKEARRLAKMFILIGRKLKIKVRVIVTDGRQPIGNGIGPVLEARDVMKVLRNDPDAPADLREKCLRMAGTLLEMGKKATNGYEAAKEILESGQAYTHMQRIIRAQGKQKKYLLGKYQKTIFSGHSGVVIEIDNDIISKIARIAGCPHDKGAGMYLHKKVGQTITKGEPLYTIYAESSKRLGYALDFVKKNKGYVIS